MPRRRRSRTLVRSGPAGGRRAIAVSAWAATCRERPDPERSGAAAEGRAVTEIPRDRFDIDAYYHPEPGTPGKTHTRFGAFVDGITEFDPVFAGIAPKNAPSIDPQQRLFVSVCWNALENAGIPPLSLEGTLTGVFAGLWSFEYWHRLASRPVEELDANVVGGNLHCMARERSPTSSGSVARA
jgi:acyl transferase domain-containing protein